MKIICTRQNLVQGVTTAQRGVSAKNPLPILSGILFIAKNNSLELHATDLEMGIQCTIPANVQEEGSIVLPARYLGEIVRRLPDAPIQIDATQGNNAIIRYGQSEITINGYDAQEFPVLPNPQGKGSLSIPEEDLKEILRQVLFATSTDENRPVFTGVLMENNNGCLRLVATDTHRLALREENIGNDIEDISVIIPGKALNELARVIGAPDRNVTISLGDNQVIFSMEDTRLVSRLIEGQFPNYRQVIPRGYKTRLRMRTKELLESVERASLLARVGSQIVRLAIEEEKVIITANTEVGRIHEEVPVFLDGETTAISFNAVYLIDALRAIGSDNIYLDLSGPLSPGILRPVEEDNYLSLVLPVRTS
ncbi:DNA polymerase III, beta subunit [Desulfotomaculum nigrificans CO-1-SRB]|uniref:Beta sliding clamp n=1 Tax=Desulfotomaculum nigrificans (strain DSM 14880 / VKM B-2319 / CO-1-SRB) TaxID=868595 RepID=F6B3U2_DESCC|nr:DNA polymerase III subunit beta [Desulfotomaculum nigrificans]AEF92907.1 DNA polymerase III, beta subunit [Desulfotomaculum nigrificans CO-1-SRB]